MINVKRNSNSTNSPSGLKLYHIFHGHNDQITRLSWTPDGKTVISAARDGTIRSWSIETKNEITKYKGHSSGANSVSISGDGKLISAGFRNGLIKIWDIEKKKNICNLKGHQHWVSNVEFTRDRRFVISSSFDKTIKIWDLAKNNELYSLLGHTAEVNTLKVFSNKLFISGAYDGTLILWDIFSRKRLKSYDSKEECVNEIAISHNKKIIAIATNTIHIIDLEHWSNSFILSGHLGFITCISFSADDKYLASKSADGTVMLWRTKDWKIVSIMEETANSFEFAGLAFNPHYPILATQGDNNTSIRIWDLNYSDLVPIKPPIPAKTLYRNYFVSPKIVIVGEQSSGKTCLARALLREKFEPQESTHGMNISFLHTATLKYKKLISIEREIVLWDLAGQYDYHLIHQLFLDETSLAIVLFDPNKPDDPFSQIEFWNNAIKSNTNKDCPLILVAGRIDRGGPTYSKDEIEKYCKSHGFKKYIETSAKTGSGIQELLLALNRFIPWDKLTQTFTPQNWEYFREYILKRREGEELIIRSYDLQESFFQRYPDLDISKSEYEEIVKLAHFKGLIWRLSFGNYILLKPELLSIYASIVTNEARRNKNGLGCVLLQKIFDADLDFADIARIKNKESEKVLLHVLVELFLEREVAVQVEEHLLFPSKLKQKHPEYPHTPKKENSYTFSGQTETIYATLVVRLTYSGAFKLKKSWKDSAEFFDIHNQICGITLNLLKDGKGIIDIFFGNQVLEESKNLFKRFVYKHIKNRALKDSLVIDNLIMCPNCNYEISDNSIIQKRIERGDKIVRCLDCDYEISIVPVESLKLDESPKKIEKLSEQAMNKKKEVINNISKKIKNNLGEYDVFFAYNSADQENVNVMYTKLLENNIRPWFDKYDLPPGRRFAEVIENILPKTKSMAIFIGKAGMSNWVQMELYSALNEFTKKIRPIIPILLPGTKEISELPIFLQQFKCIRFKKSINDSSAVNELIWGITGNFPN